MKELLFQNSDVFAWSTTYMPNISLIVITHVLNVSLKARPMRQKKRKSTPNRIQATKEETETLLKAGFIREVQYPN